MKYDFGKIFLLSVLTLAVACGGWFTWQRYLIETQPRQVQLIVDLGEIKKMAAYEKKPLAGVMKRLKEVGISGIGVFEETLPDANAAGELYFAKGSGILRLKNWPANKFESVNINPLRTYLYIPNTEVRRRVAGQLIWALGNKYVRFIGQEIIEVNEIEEALRTVGLGISEIQNKYLTELGFVIVPRVWNDQRYHLGNIEGKIAVLKGYPMIIFDGDELLGYPEAIPALAAALKKFNISYGYIEIVKQAGDQRLNKMLGDQVARVHSVPKDELKKIDKGEAIDRFARAVRERGVNVIYLRPFLPPQIEASPIDYNLKYFSEIKSRLEKAGVVLSRSKEARGKLTVTNWQLLLLGAGVIVGGIFLIQCFVLLPMLVELGLFFLAMGLIFISQILGWQLMLQKLLVFIAALIFPAYGVIWSFSRPFQESKILLFWKSLFLVLQSLAVTVVGIILMLGLLADYRFMNGLEVFPLVKLALVLPIFIVGSYLLFKVGEGDLKTRLTDYINYRVSVGVVIGGGILLAALALLVARSGNFSLPVPAAEKYFRNWLEVVLFVRPRTKEFLVGYPLLFVAAWFYFKSNQKWLWVVAAIGTIAPISVFNTFSHIHTPLVLSLIRTLNGLVLGIIAGGICLLLIQRYTSKGASH